MRTRILVAAALAALGTGLLAPTGVAAAPADGPAIVSARAPLSAPGVTRGWRLRMLDKINAVRATSGAAPLRLCDSLGTSAMTYAGQMSTTDHFGHIALDGSGPGERIVSQGYQATLAGENLGAGQGTVVQVMRALRASPTHLATMTDPRFRHVGFGYAPGGSSRYRTYWVQHFGVGGTC